MNSLKHESRMAVLMIAVGAVVLFFAYNAHAQSVLGVGANVQGTHGSSVSGNHNSNRIGLGADIGVNAGSDARANLRTDSDTRLRSDNRMDVGPNVNSRTRMSTERRNDRDRSLRSDNDINDDASLRARVDANTHDNAGVRDLDMTNRASTTGTLDGAAEARTNTTLGADLRANN